MSFILACVRHWQQFVILSDLFLIFWQRKCLYSFIRLTNIWIWLNLQILSVVNLLNFYPFLSLRKFIIALVMRKMLKGDLEHEGIKIQRLQPRAKPFELYAVPWTSFWRLWWLPCLTSKTLKRKCTYEMHWNTLK